MTRTFLSRCQRLRQCGFAPNCVCDVDPTDPRDVAEWQAEPLREEIAIILWQRFAPTHHIGWKDETHKAEYLLAADDVMAAFSSTEYDGATK